MEKETRHVFISLFLVHGRGGLGLTPLLQRLYTLYKLHGAKSLGNSFRKSPEFPMQPHLLNAGSTVSCKT